MSRHSRGAWVLGLGLSLGWGLGCDSAPSKSEPVAAKAEPKAEPAPPGEPKTSAATPPIEPKPGEPEPTPAEPEPTPAEPTPGEPEPTPAEPTPGEPAPTPAEPTPGEPEPSTGSPTATSVPAGAVASDTALSEKMKRRLRSKLREQHDALVDLPAALALVDPSGNVTVFGLYEYSEVEACVSKTDGSKEARKACANARTDDNDRPLPALRKCTLRGLVRARFGPPPKSNPAYGGALEVLGTRPFPGGCTITKVRRLELVDVDGDRQPELEVDVLSKTPESYFIQDEDFDEERGKAETFEMFTRTLGWYRADLSPQYEADITTWHTEIVEAMTDGTATRVRLADANGDGRPDLSFETMSYDVGDCRYEEDGWPIVGSDPDEGCAGDVTAYVWPYDPAKDQWVEGG